MTSLHTLAVHAARPATGEPSIPSVPAIELSVSYRATHASDLHAMLGGELAGPSYSRYGSPTVEALERALAALEGVTTARATASGMAAIHLAILLSGVQAGETILAAQDCYGATFALLEQVLQPLGMRVAFVDATDLAVVRAALSVHHPRALLVEPVSNPLLKIADLPALASLVHDHGAQLIVDATFVTPYLLQPFALGADIVVHSLTKYLAGHDDVLGGVVLAREEYAAKLRQLLILTGANLDPHAAYLALRGLRTLPLRMREHCQNAAIVAEALSQHPLIERVYYPGLAEHPQHALATELLDNRFGGMIAFDLRNGERAAVERFFDALQMILPVTTLGGVASQILYPALSSHRALPVERRRELGVGDGLVRLSVGIEAAEDILADLDQALNAALLPSQTEA